MIIPKHNILNKLSLFHNLQEYKDNNYPDSIFYHKNGKIYFELDLKNNYLWCDYTLVWTVFSNNNELDYSETQSVIKNVLEQHTNLGSVTPHRDSIPKHQKLEQHTNLGSVTPVSGRDIQTLPLEQHTNLGSVTPSKEFCLRTTQLEQHTNLGSVTPNGSSSPLTVLLEQHTNLGSVTPEIDF